MLTGAGGDGSRGESSWTGDGLMDTATVERLSGALRSHGKVSESTRSVIERWLSDPNYEVFGPDIAKLVESEQWGELEDAFYTQLTVGTGGIRGRVGPGTNRINL